VPPDLDLSLPASMPSEEASAVDGPPLPVEPEQTATDSEGDHLDQPVG
jgi:hypothetical protein